MRITAVCWSAPIKGKGVRPKGFPVGTRSVHFWPRCARCGILGRGRRSLGHFGGVPPEEITPRCDWNWGALLLLANKVLIALPYCWFEYPTGQTDRCQCLWGRSGLPVSPRGHPDP